MFFKKPQSIYNLSEKTDSELLQIIAGTNPASDQHTDSVVELEYRRSLRDFWSKGIVAWIALVIGSISLIWQIAKELW